MVCRTLAGSGRVAVLLVVGSLSAWGQGTQTASVTGSVMDAGDAAITGALVRLTSPSLQGARIVSTDDKGRFAARLLPPGDYLIEITKADYQTIQLQQRLGIDQNFQPRFRMAKRQSVVVEVVAAPPAVDKTDVKTASNYRMDLIDLLPMGRNVESIALLTPGVVQGVRGDVQIRGAMTTGNLILVDGQNVEDGTWGISGVSLIEDALEETQVLTGALSAEYGYVDGGVINSITRSGSNVLSGQIRLDFQNPQWNAVGPLVDRSGINDHTGIDTTFSLGGYLVKDRLWFYTSFFNHALREVRTIDSAAFSDPNWPGGAGSTYTFKRDEIRRQLKLTWLVHPDHTLVMSYMNADAADDKRDYQAGSISTLVPQLNKDELFNLSWRALWSPYVITDIRYGLKRELRNPGTTRNSTSLDASPIAEYASSDYLFYNHGVFNGDDGGDHRDNQTFAAKTSLFLDGQGSHQVDLGLDWYQGIRQARSETSPTGHIFEVRDLDPLTQMATPVSVWVFESRPGKATVEKRGLYANDKWIVNEHLALQLGLRWDRYEDRAEGGNRLAGSSAFSPRLGLKYDFRGDSTWIAGASHARYNGKLLDQILTNATNQGNLQEVDYAWNGPTGSLPYGQIFDPNNYDFSANGVRYASIPGVTIRLNPDLKAPIIDEQQVSLAYSFKDTPIGTGYVRTTAVYKNWKNLVDYRIGNDGQGTYVIPQSGEIYQPYIYYWDNNPDAKRNYKALELEFATAKHPWQFQGNLTWSRLWGNYEGQEAGDPAKGEGIHAWDITNGQVMFDRNITAPEGYLQGHVPFRARILGTYTLDSHLGTTTLGLMYRFDSGSSTSETRAISGSALNADPSWAARDTNFLQYKDNRRGTNPGHSSWYLDLSVNHEWNLFRAKQVPVRGFLKAVIKNVLNHKQLLRTPKSYESAVDSPANPWVPDANYGVPGPEDYGEPRTYSFSMGVRF